MVVEIDMALVGQTVNKLAFLRLCRRDLGLPVRIKQLGPYRLEPQEARTQRRANDGRTIIRGYRVYKDGAQVLSMNADCTSPMEMKLLSFYVNAELDYCRQLRGGFTRSPKGIPR